MILRQNSWSIVQRERDVAFGESEDTVKNIEREVRSHPFLSGLRENHLGAICAEAKEVDFQPGQIILREREPAFNAYLLTSGKVNIEVHSREYGREVVVDTVGAGEVLGWSWLFAPFCWHFQARAIEPSHAIVLDGALLMVRCEEDPQLGYTLMKRITQTLIRRVEAMRRRILELNLSAKPMVPTAPVDENRGHV